MKNIILAISIAALVSQGWAQSELLTPLTVKGTLNIAFNTVATADADGKPQVGATDVYTFKDLNVANSAKFRGTLVKTPYISGTFGTKQEAKMEANIDCDVINPKNLAQSMNVGKMVGVVPVDKQNVYHFDQGSMVISVIARGKANAFESRFNGTAIGKPPGSGGGLLDKIKKIPISITRSIHGSNVTMVVTNYDKMEFQNHILAAGPVQTYPETTVNGTMLYDYTRNAWHFQNFFCIYASGGRQAQDSINGSIRWIPDPQRAANGKGVYEFDITVNEPPPTESSAFAPPTDEASFFQTDDSIPGLTGTMSYTDTITSDPKSVNTPDETVSASAIVIDLTATKLTKQQVMNLVKFIMFSAIVPMNSE